MSIKNSSFKMVITQLIFVVFFFLSSSSFKIYGQAPEAVKNCFKNKYPGENDPDWHKDKNGNYEANFKKKNKHYKADFKPTGEWIETERRISYKKLPKAVKGYIKSQFKKSSIVEIEEVDHFSKGRFYDVEIKEDGKKKDYEIDKFGRLLQ